MPPIATTDATVFAAFTVGCLSFLSPCVLPLVPGYLSTVSGVSVGEMQKADGRVLGRAAIFCLAFSLMFVALGMSATAIGATLRDHQAQLNTIAGWTIIAMGGYIIAAQFLVRLNRDFRSTAFITKASEGNPVIAGLAFGIAWTPCVGPTLASILAAASTSTTVGEGGLLLAFYSAGLAVPFLLTAVAFTKAYEAFRVLRRHHQAISIISGLILISMGSLIVTGQLGQLNSEAQRLLDVLGIDWLYRL